MFGRTARLGGAIATFGNVPLVVLAAGKPNPVFGPMAKEYQKYWIEQSRVLAAKSTKGRFLLAEWSSHYLYLDAPEVVAENILAVVRAVRAETLGTQETDANIGNSARQ